MQNQTYYLYTFMKQFLIIILLRTLTLVKLSNESTIIKKLIVSLLFFYPPDVILTEGGSIKFPPTKHEASCEFLQIKSEYNKTVVQLLAQC